MFLLKVFALLLSSWLVFGVNAHAQYYRTSVSTQFEFALLGNLSYAEKDFWKLDNIIEAINSNQALNWVLQTGDVNTYSPPCPDTLYNNQSVRFQQLNIPVILMPNTGKAMDCQRYYDSARPLERGHIANSAHPFKHSEQADYVELAENLRWIKNNVVFATLHIAENDDPSVYGKKAAKNQHSHTNTAVEWIRMTFNEAKAKHARGVFIFAWENPSTDKQKTLSDQLLSETILSSFRQESMQYGKPVILALGSEDYSRLTKQQIDNIRKTKNLTLIQTPDAHDAHWHRVVVQPDSSQVFTFQREIVEKNLEHHSAY